jgi:hypothetical protein
VWIELKPLSIVYWSRVCFGIVAALICAVGYWASAELFNTFLQGLSMAIVVYIISHYFLKWQFIAKVEKPSKVFTTGIGAYFFTWIVTWTLFFTVVYLSR